MIPQWRFGYERPVLSAFGVCGSGLDTVPSQPFGWGTGHIEGRQRA